MEKILDFIQGNYAGSGFGFIIHWIVIIFLGITVMYIAVTALGKFMEYLSIIIKQEEPAVQAKPLNHADQAGSSDKSGNTDMNEAAAAIGLALHIYRLKNSARNITVQRAYGSSWKEMKRAGAMERI